MVWEIVELENGEIALVRDEGDEPLLTIGFSREARERLNENTVEVAKAMIGAGMDAVETMEDEDAMLEGQTDWGLDFPDGSTTLH